MKILFLGLGSIGTRHLRLMQARQYPFEFFALKSGQSQNPTPGIQYLKSWQEVESIHPDVAFICNPTSLHIESALECARRGIHLFLEKPIGNSLDLLNELQEVVQKKNLTAYVGYPLRFHTLVDKLRDKLPALDPFHVRYVSSSYLPSWRPGQDHKNSYSVKHGMGGGVLLDLSHEFDLIEYLFGSSKILAGVSHRQSDVTIDAEDFADLILETENPKEKNLVSKKLASKNIIINLHMNFYSRFKERSVTVDGHSGSVRIDIANGIYKADVNGHEETLHLDIAADEMYTRQLEYFFKNLGNAQLMNNLQEATPLYKKILEFRNGSHNESGKSYE